MHGKVVLITGGSSGIGKYTALDLAKRGANVILTCRDMTKGKFVADWIVEESGNPNIFLHYLDLSDLNSVRTFAETISKSENKLDVLINNAGTTSKNYVESPQGYELTFATNHLGPFLLTHLLMELLKNAPSARIINVSSMMHKRCRLSLNDLHSKNSKNYSSYGHYGQSKLCNILFTNELAEKLKENGITANSLHPGVVATSISGREGSVMGTFIGVILFPLIGKSSESGAQTSIHLAVSEEVAKITGEYFVDCKFLFQIAGKSKDAENVLLAKELWELSEKFVHLQDIHKI